MTTAPRLGVRSEHASPIRLRILGVLVALPRAACATITETIADWPEPSLYDGFRDDVHTLWHGGRFPRLFGFVGAPFSLIGDTLCLPVDVVLWAAGFRAEDD